MNISNLDKAKVLAALYNHAQPQSFGVLHFKPEDMTTEQAQALLDGGQTYFDYLHGRVMKVDLSGDELRTELYNRDNGHQKAERVLARLVA